MLRIASRIVNRLRAVPIILLLLIAPTAISLSLRPFSTILSSAANKQQNSANQVGTTTTVENSWAERTGESALFGVQYLASKVAESNAAYGDDKPVTKAGSLYVSGSGGNVYNNVNFNMQKAGSTRSGTISRPNLKISSKLNQQDQVWTALANLELDSEFDYLKCYSMMSDTLLFPYVTLIVVSVFSFFCILQCNSSTTWLHKNHNYLAWSLDF